MHGEITLKKIAEVCGVSAATVSQILNNRPSNYSSEKTKKLVLETARRLGYRKNFVYALMHGEKTATVAIMLHMHRGMYEEYMRDLVLRLTQAFELRNHACYVVVLGPDAEENLRKTREYLSRGVGYFIMLYNPVGFEEIAELVEKSGALLTGINDTCPRYVMSDYQEPFRRLLNHVRSKVGEEYRFLNLSASLSCPRCTVLHSLYPELSFEELTRTYVRTLEPFKELPESFPQEAYNAGFSTALKVISEEPRIKALVCTNDAFALGAAAAVRKSGKTVGEDVLLTGCNNDSTLHYFPDPISSIDFNWGKHIDTLADAALSQEPCRFKFSAELIIREKNQ